MKALYSVANVQDSGTQRPNLSSLPGRGNYHSSSEGRPLPLPQLHRGPQPPCRLSPAKPHLGGQNNARPNVWLILTILCIHWGLVVWAWGEGPAAPVFVRVCWCVCVCVGGQGVNFKPTVLQARRVIISLAVIKSSFVAPCVGTCTCVCVCVRTDRFGVRPCK